MATNTQKIGLMCGTFDPPHLGHLILAQTTLTNLGLDKILFLPVGDPTHKTTKTAAKHRVEMVRLAIQNNPEFELDTTDADRPGPHYTASLLPLLQTNYPTADFWLLMGSDSLKTFPSWHQPSRILEQCRLAVLRRPGFEPDVETMSKTLPTLSKKIVWLDGPFISLSSSWLRQQLQNDRSLRYLLISEVQNFAEDQQLYG